MNRAMVYGPCARVRLPQGRFSFHPVVDVTAQRLPSYTVHANRIVTSLRAVA